MDEFTCSGEAILYREAQIIERRDAANSGLIAEVKRLRTTAGSAPITSKVKQKKRI